MEEIALLGKELGRTGRMLGRGGYDMSSEKYGEFLSYKHACGQLAYHIEWCPKYRYKIFRKEFVRKTFEEILLSAMKEYGVEVFQIAVMPDHVHLIVELHPSMSPSQATSLLKGRTSYEMFRRLPRFGKLYRKRRLWSPEKLYRTTGVDLETTTECVRNNDLN